MYLRGQDSNPAGLTDARDQTAWFIRYFIEVEIFDCLWSPDVLAVRNNHYSCAVLLLAERRVHEDCAKLTLIIVTCAMVSWVYKSTTRVLSMRVAKLRIHYRCFSVTYPAGNSVICH